jgi:hypothetical protein
MTGPSPHPDDDELIARLGALAREADPVPDSVLEAGRAAFLLRRLDAELAELVHDSALDAAGAVRGGGERLLSFEGGDVTVELQVTPRADRLALLGQLVGVDPPVGLVVETATGRVEVPVDEAGMFRQEVAQGLFRLHVTPGDRSAVVTSWVTG